MKNIPPIKYELTEKETTDYYEFITKTRKRKDVTNDDLIIVTFTHTGIGNCVEVSIGQHSKNITDYDSW